MSKVTRIENFPFGFGRVVKPDFRDHKFLATPPVPPSDLRYKYYPTGPILDQGYTSQCVGYSTKQWLVTGPIHNRDILTPEQIYLEAQKNDAWEGEAYEGTSVRGAFKVLQDWGYISEYTWAFDIETIINYVLTTGPMVLGTLWSDDMLYPDRYGFIHAGGNILDGGGHAYMTKGVNRDYKCPDGSVGAVRICNSWGRSWGYNGLAWISFKDLEILIKEDGEACCSTEIKKVG